MSDQISPEGYVNIDDIHLVQLCLDMRQAAELERESTDLENPGGIHGDRPCIKNDPAADVQTSGAKVQQILIEDSVFQEAAAAIAPGQGRAVAPVDRKGPLDPGLKALADALLDEARHPTVGGDLYADTLAQQIALRILRRRKDLPRPVRPSGKTLSAADMARLTVHVDRDLAVPGGVDALATLLDMEPFAFSRAFKETTGQTPHQYLIDRRILHAKALLLNGRLGLAEIAYETGFSSQSHMTSTFKKRVGVAPGRWRKQAKGKIES
ncbi:MAG: AraC family transcriptional regulator [Pseudomonadota bacterium]